jgi:hypothetical protein
VPSLDELRRIADEMPAPLDGGYAISAVRAR